ncbi:hypothetical protein GGR53DRAFT_521153 [Hypoxylon sp. FL1150]|nr:hypothetical protein GGR53DRAFT_521153 [Hypoxylon sp. FL1150]
MLSHVVVPDDTTAQDVKEFLSEDGKKSLGQMAALWATHAGILKIVRDVKNGKHDMDDDDNLSSALIDVADCISIIILPVCDGASPEDDTTDYVALREKADIGIATIEELIKALPGGASQLQASTHLRLAAFTWPKDPWMSGAMFARSCALLNDLEPQARARLITEDILTSFLRPLFSKSRPAAITASGRKAEFVEESRYDSVANESPETKPWKYAHRYAVTVFAWAVQQTDSELLQKHWPLYTPVLLTLLDEPAPAALKVRALGLFRVFWKRCPADLMQQTGLAEVFEQAVFPAVLYLPSLTPAEESLKILGAAYPALVEMAGLAAGSIDDYVLPFECHSPDGGGRQLTEAQRKLLDKIIREGVIVGYHHAKEHIRIVGLLCETLAWIVNGMGILAVKYLKDIVPMASEILTDPFGTKHPPTLLSAVQLLQAMLRKCWPRIPHYCNEILKALTLSWLNIKDEDSFHSDDLTVSELKSELVKSADMLSAIMKATRSDLSERVNPLIEKEPELSKLFRAAN